jgi:hypothetical protein
MRVGLGLVLLLVPVAARAATLVAVLADGSLAVFPADRPAEARAVRPTGVSGRLVAADVRPADGRLYALAGTSDLYRLDPASGQATLVATLTVPFDGAERSGMDFNPQADRLRLVSDQGQNVRVHPTLGAAALDRPLAWATGDAHAGRRPRVVAAAYTSAVRDAPATKLFVIDAEQDVLALQEPPNDGVLTTVGPLGVDVGALTGFDVVTDAGGQDHAWAASARTLYRVDLHSGRATPAGTLGGAGPEVVGLAALP